VTGIEIETDDETQPTIVAAHVAAGHDGLAEIAIRVGHPNGALRDICFPHEAIGPVLDAAGISSLDDLVGLPWTVLLGPITPPPKPSIQPSAQSSQLTHALDHTGASSWT
jgi:hypothetical protein